MKWVVKIRIKNLFRTSITQTAASILWWALYNLLFIVFKECPLTNTAIRCSEATTSSIIAPRIFFSLKVNFKPISWFSRPQCKFGDTSTLKINGRYHKISTKRNLFVLLRKRLIFLQEWTIMIVSIFLEIYWLFLMAPTVIATLKK